MAAKRPTLKQIAEETGLSVTAVSYALRGEHVSAATIARVREKADELGYTADPVARALRGGRTGVVGLLVGSLADFWQQTLAHAIQRELRARGLHAILADGGEPGVVTAPFAAVARADSIAIEGKSFHDPLVPTGPGVREPKNRRAVIDLDG